MSLPLTSPDEATRYRAMGLWRDVTFFDLFKAAVERHPNKVAVIAPPHRYTYGQLLNLVENLAGNLVGLGLASGDAVAIQTKNAVEHPILHLACNRIGALLVPLHDTWRDTEVGHLLNQARARMVVVPSEYRGFDHAAMIASIRADLPMLDHVFTLDGQVEGTRAFAELLQPAKIGATELDALRPDPDAPAATMLSGGTTSLSKISRFSCNDLLVMIGSFTRAIEYREDDVAAALAPAGTGATGYIFPILTPLLHGATSVILERWSDPAEATELIAEYECTYAVGIPTQLTRMVPDLEGRSRSDFPAFRCFYNSGAALLYDTGRRIEAAMGCVIQCMYGTTDGGVPVVTAIRDPQSKRLGSVGRVVLGNECELRGEAGNAVAVGQRGEVVWRGADKSWGYLADDAQTAAAFTEDRFYKSGDLGEFDEDGYLHIVGRVKDMILRGGRNIYPGTIEEQVIRHPAVLEVAVAPMPDPVLGERACAFVVLRDGQSLEFTELSAFLTGRKLAVWQLPERLELVADLPRGPGGKVLKAELTKLVAAKLKDEVKIDA
jgi:non-ribosomal peptide synthetase component E (peptide arylation enzyme)